MNKKNDWVLHMLLCVQKIFEKWGDNVLVLYGDVPFISYNTLNLLYNTHLEHNNDATVLSVVLDDPTGYGRIIKDSKKIV